MGNTSSTPKATAQDKAILDLKLQRDNLIRYQKRLTLLISTSHTTALTCLQSKDQRGARLALQCKKLQTTVLLKTDAQLQQLESLTHEIEIAQMQRQVFEGIKKGTAVLASIRKDMGGIEEIERVMGANEEERERMGEITDVLAGRVSSVEEDEIDEELERMERENVGAGVGKLPTAPTAIEGEKEEDRLPNVPSDTVKSRTRTKEKEQDDREAIAA